MEVAARSGSFFFQTFVFALGNRRGLLIFLLVALLSLLVKVLLATRGYNYDFELS